MAYTILKYYTLCCQEFWNILNIAILWNLDPNFGRMFDVFFQEPLNFNTSMVIVTKHALKFVNITEFSEKTTIWSQIVLVKLIIMYL